MLYDEIFRIMGEELNKAIEESGIIKLMETVVKAEKEKKNKPKKNKKGKKNKNWEKNSFFQ